MKSLSLKKVYSLIDEIYKKSSYDTVVNIEQLLAQHDVDKDLFTQNELAAFRDYSYACYEFKKNVVYGVAQDEAQTFYEQFSRQIQRSRFIAGVLSGMVGAYSGLALSGNEILSVTLGTFAGFLIGDLLEKNTKLLSSVLYKVPRPFNIPGTAAHLKYQQKKLEDMLL